MPQLYEQEAKAFNRYLKRRGIDANPMTIQIIVSFYQTYLNSLQDVHDNTAVITQYGDKGQEIKKINPHFTVMGESTKQLMAVFKQLGLTPRSEQEILKIMAETTAMTPADEALQKYMDGGLPE